MHHLGRHPDKYHEYMYEKISFFNSIAKGDQETFISLFEGLKEYVKNNPEILIKEHWRALIK